MAKKPSHDDYDRDILDIIPERYDAPDDIEEERGGGWLRFVLLGLAAIVVLGVGGAAAWKHYAGHRLPGVGVPVIKADDTPVKIKPDDRGGMQIPNQDKLVYNEMEGDKGTAQPRTERLLAPPEEPVQPNAPLMSPPKTVEPPPSSMVKAEPPPAPPAVAAAPRVPVIAAPPPIKAPTAPKMAAVEAPPTAPVAAAKKAAPAPVAAGNYLVQLGAVRSAEEADKEWNRIKKANGDVLTGLSLDVMQVELPGKGTYWRIRAGTMAEAAAKSVCQQMSSRNQGCIVVRK